MRNGKLLTGALLGAVVALLLTIGVFAVRTTEDVSANQEQIAQNEEQLRRINTVLLAECVRRDRLDTQIARTRKLLDASRGRKTVFGIPRSLIVVNYGEDVAERRTLEILDC